MNKKQQKVASKDETAAKSNIHLQVFSFFSITTFFLQSPDTVIIRIPFLKKLKCLASWNL